MTIKWAWQQQLLEATASK